MGDLRPLLVGLGNLSVLLAAAISKVPALVTLLDVEVGLLLGGLRFTDPGLALLVGLLLGLKPGLPFFATGWSTDRGDSGKMVDGDMTAPALFDTLVLPALVPRAALEGVAEGPESPSMGDPITGEAARGEGLA